MEAVRSSGLLRLARLYGVQTAFKDITGQRRTATPDALLAILRALRAPVEHVTDAPDAARHRRQELWRRWLEPVAVVWAERKAAVRLRLPERAAGDRLRCRIRLESGETRSWTAALPELHATERATVEGVEYRSWRLPLPAGLPWGYHRLRVQRDRQGAESLLIVAPRRSYGGRERAWGVFLPLYALATRRSWGIGDLTDLAQLGRWIAGAGGAAVGTLPLLAAFLGEEPYAPSPYAPVSRLFWNELYVDPERAPELERSRGARARLVSPAWREDRTALRRARLVDYRRQMAMKRGVLEKLAHTFFVSGGASRPEFERFVQGHPRVEDYAAFRATCERRSASWHAWPSRLRDGQLRKGDFDERARRYHVYVQWLAERQMAEFAAPPADEPETSAEPEPAGRRGAARKRGTNRTSPNRGRRRSTNPSPRPSPSPSPSPSLSPVPAGLYLDLPLGVHPDGYDVWRERELFARGASGGAPPDDFFIHGQDWGFPALHPEASRLEGHRYLRDALRHHLRHARMLRIDHVMSLHRLYWVPHGMDARDGAYVRYPAEELYAILCLESHRHRTRLVGEDLGTVPREVRRAMARHRVRRMHVVQYEVSPDADRPLAPAPRASVAGLNTHDMPPFAAFWEESDIADRRELGLLDEDRAREERERRRRIKDALIAFLQRRGLLTEEPATGTALRALLRHLARGPAEFVLINLEDLWLEPKPQNVPGTTAERPNWRRKAAHGLDSMRRLPDVVETLEDIERLRRRGENS